MIISISYSLCIYWVYRRAQAHLNVNLALDLCLIIMVSGLIGSRLTHVIFENWGYYKGEPLAILKLWQGGFVYYGGFFTALISSLFFLHLKKERISQWADMMAPVISIGYALGRLGCFFSGCCYGKECALPWAIEFHQLGLPTGPRHPTQLYASLWDTILVVLILYLERKKIFKVPGSLFVAWLGMHAAGRLVMEHFREDYRGPLIFSLSLSTVLSLIVILFSMLYFFFKQNKCLRNQS